MKKMMMLWIMVAVMVSSTLLPAQPAPELGDNPPPMPEELKLNKEQRQNIEQLTLKLKKELVPLRSQLELKMIDLKMESDNENPDLGRINNLVDESAKIRAEIAKKSIANKITIARLLTPEQRELWKERKGMMRREAMRDRRPGHKGNRHRLADPPQPPLEQ